MMIALCNVVVETPVYIMLVSMSLRHRCLGWWSMWILYDSLA
jgi:hypothetical protein